MVQEMRVLLNLVNFIEFSEFIFSIIQHKALNVLLPYFL